MKKILTLLIMWFFVFTLTDCGKNLYPPKVKHNTYISIPHKNDSEHKNR